MLQVKLCAPLDDERVPQPVGYYIHAKVNVHYSKPLIVRFVRERDARLAVNALLAAGLRTHARLKRAGASIVLSTMMEALQW